MIEETLAKSEGAFVNLIEHKVEKHYDVDRKDKANLCVFAAAMFSRVDSQSRIFVSFLQEIHENVRRMEEEHNAEPRTCLETAAMLENARPKYVATSLQMLAEMYYGMSMGIFVAPATDHFITSDSPTVWYNPEAYKWPPFWRSPGLAQEKVEVTMPLTPKYALYLSHNDKISGYRQLPARLVQEVNRRTRFHCDQWFISWRGEVRQEWLTYRPRFIMLPKKAPARSFSERPVQPRQGMSGAPRTGVAIPHTFVAAQPRACLRAHSPIDSFGGVPAAEMLRIWTPSSRANPSMSTGRETQLGNSGTEATQALRSAHLWEGPLECNSLVVQSSKWKMQSETIVAKEPAPRRRCSWFSTQHKATEIGIASLLTSGSTLEAEASSMLSRSWRSCSASIRCAIWWTIVSRHTPFSFAAFYRSCGRPPPWTDATRFIAATRISANDVTRSPY